MDPDFRRPEAAEPASTVPLQLTATIEPGWHLYSLTIPKDLLPTTIKVIDNPAVESFSVYQPKPVRAMDPNLKQEMETYSNQAEFWIPATLTKDATGPLELTAQVRYRVCDDKQCLQPQDQDRCVPDERRIRRPRRWRRSLFRLDISKLNRADRRMLWPRLRLR